ncbi:hypothetical protein T01_7333 [Trichinella spiralis]|uniref:RanBD1 domain-containing protein n=1 Tax=Trichinella spiralis TaxID=6334 RepID=A0A0V1AYP2_TRISP|nr:hypothetical protein T01_7333 [Trichinella spiralis]
MVLRLLADIIRFQILRSLQILWITHNNAFTYCKLSTCVKTEMNNEQHSVPECEAKYDKEDMILEQLKIITNVQDTTKRLYSIIESGIISRCASQFDGNVETMRLNNENYAVEKICIPAGTLKTKDALISKYENLKSQEFYDSTTSKMQVSAINGSETVSNSKSVAEQKIIKRDEKESDSKLQLWANFPTGASSFQRQKQAEKNTEVCSEQQAKSCLSSTISKEYKNQESQMIAEEQLLEMMEVPSDEQEVNFICEYKDKKSYEEIGTGALKLLFNKRTGTYIIFMSEEKSQKIVLNHGVTSQLNMRPSSLMNNAFMWQCRNTTD